MFPVTQTEGRMVRLPPGPSCHLPSSTRHVLEKENFRLLSRLATECHCIAHVRIKANSTAAPQVECVAHPI